MLLKRDVQPIKQILKHILKSYPNLQFEEEYNYCTAFTLYDYGNDLQIKVDTLHNKIYLKQIYNSYEVTHNITSIRNLKAYLKILDRIGA